MNKLIPVEVIEGKILMVRGHKVMLDRDLARLYGVPTKRLNEQVKRNIKRFPPDFMFQLNDEEYLRSQFATSKRGGKNALQKGGDECIIYALYYIVESEALMKNEV